jgi:hypothetical protein
MISLTKLNIPSGGGRGRTGQIILESEKHGKFHGNWLQIQLNKSSRFPMNTDEAYV